MNSLVIVLTVIIIALLGFIGFLLFGREHPCVRVVELRQQIDADGGERTAEEQNRLEIAGVKCSVAQ